MKKLLKICLILLLSAISVYSEIDVEKVKSDFEVMQKSGNAGREFWLSVTPVHLRSYSPDSINFYILSTVKSKVDISVGRKFYSMSFDIEPNIVKLVRIDTSIVNPIKADSTKLKDADIYPNSGIYIKSDYPIIVYVYTKRAFHSDGYFAIPTVASSNRYINMNYYSSDYGNLLFPCYTSVISHSDNTNVKITMGGGKLADDEIEFEDGRKIKTGESTTQLMNKGDLLLLSANGNLQDISGSLIESDKPITIQSGISQATLPINKGYGELLTTMEFPTKLWGTNFFFTPMNHRDSAGVFRAFATENNTKVYRNGQLMGTLSKGGGADYGESYIEFDTGEKYLNKPATVTSDKPIALVYYNYYIRNKEIFYYHHSPHMMQIPAIEQGVNCAIIAAPDNYKEGDGVYILNHVAITFPLINNTIPKDIEIITYDSLGIAIENTKLFEEYEDNLNIFEGEFENKKYGSITMLINRNYLYVLKSKTNKFVTYTYGTGLNSSHGLPTGFSLFDRSTKDSQSPVVYYEQDCDGNINLNTATVTDMPMNEENRSNIADAYMMAGENYEFKWEAESGEFIPGRNQTLKWSLEKINKSKPASALLYFVDKAGNDTTIFIESQSSANLEMLSSVNEIRNPKFKTYLFQDTIKNPSSYQSLYITRIELSGKTPKFHIDSFEPSGWTPGIPIPPNQERYINYTFTDDKIEDNQTYTDSIYIGIGVNNGNQITECDFKPFSEIAVNTIYPSFFVTQKQDFGIFDDKSKSIKLQDTIRNLSTKTDLYLSRIELKEKDRGFSIGSFSPFDWNLTKPIKPEGVVIVDIIFNPKLYPQTKDEQILVDSLGIGIQEYDKNNELEEVSFSYRTEHKAIIKAKDPESSVASDKVLAQYMNVTESSIELLPKVLENGFYDLSIYTLEGTKLISIATDKQNTISLSKLTTGTYIVTLKSATQLLSKKISLVR